MIKHTLAVQPRTTTGRQVKRLRAQGTTPANIFGKKIPSVAIQLNTKTFSKLRREVGESTLLYMQVEGEKDERPVLVRDIVFHPVSQEILHISFNQVNLKEKVTAPVAITLTGESPAEREKLGILVQQLDEVEVEALPTDIPEGFQVDISGLAEVGASIAVKDLSIDASKITIKTDPEAVLVKIEPLAAEEKVEAPIPVAAPVEGAATVPPVEGAASTTPTPSGAEAPAKASPAPEKK